MAGMWIPQANPAAGAADGYQLLLLFAEQAWHFCEHVGWHGRLHPQKLTCTQHRCPGYQPICVAA